MSFFSCAEKTIDIINELLKIFGETDGDVDRDIAVLKLVLDSFDDNAVSKREWSSLKIAFKTAIEHIEARLIEQMGADKAG